MLWVIINPCHAEQIKMPCTLLIVSQSDSLIKIVDINSDTKVATSADPDQLASALFAKAGYNRAQQDRG